MSRKVSHAWRTEVFVLLVNKHLSWLVTVVAIAVSQAWLRLLIRRVVPCVQRMLSVIYWLPLQQRARQNGGIRTKHKHTRTRTLITDCMLCVPFNLTSSFVATTTTTKSKFMYVANKNICLQYLFNYLFTNACSPPEPTMSATFGIQ